MVIAGALALAEEVTAWSGTEDAVEAGTCKSDRLSCVVVVVYTTPFDTWQVIVASF